MSMLDRPISEYEGPVDSVRVPVVEPTGNCKPFQEVLIELASRLKFPAFTREDGTHKFKDYPDCVVNFQAQPGVGFLMGAGMKLGTYGFLRFTFPLYPMHQKAKGSFPSSWSWH